MAGTKELSLDYIKEHTLYATEDKNGFTVTGSYEDLVPVADDAIEPASYPFQPEELQPFYKARWKAFLMTHDLDLFDLETFYEKWKEDPHHFEPVKREPIGSLHEYLNQIGTLSPKRDETDVIINNYDNETLGNHRLKNFVNALSVLGPAYDFDVVEYRPKNPTELYSTDCLIIQEDAENKVSDLDILANRFAVRDGFLSYDSFNGQNPEPFYEITTDKRGRDRVSGMLTDQGKIFPVSMNASYGSHRFTHDELVSLLSGQEIMISDFKTKSGDIRDIRGKIAEQFYMGNKFYGFIRTDLSSEKRKGVSLVMDDDKESERVFDKF